MHLHCTCTCTCVRTCLITLSINIRDCVCLTILFWNCCLQIPFWTTYYVIIMLLSIQLKADHIAVASLSQELCTWTSHNHHAWLQLILVCPIASDSYNYSVRLVSNVYIHCIHVHCTCTCTCMSTLGRTKHICTSYTYVRDCTLLSELTSTMHFLLMYRYFCSALCAGI